MSRVIPAFQQFFDGEGNPVPLGKLYFKESLSITTDKATFSDESETPGNENSNPYILDGEGRAKNIWGTGSYYSYLKDKNGVEVGNPQNPIGEGASLIPYSQWSSLLNYSQYAKVQGSNGRYHESRVDNNLGNDPISDSGANWIDTPFNGIYNATVDYGVGDQTQTSDGNLWASQVTPNIGNDPSTDLGANWLPAVNGDKIAFNEVTQHFYRNR